MKVNKHSETELIVEKINLFKRDGLLSGKGTVINAKLQLYKNEDPEEPLMSVLKVLRENAFQDILGYFSNHRPTGPYANIDNEYKVQDILFCLLRPILRDLQYEDPQSKNPGALTSTRIDLISKEHKIFIEAKFADSKHNAKKIESELSEDMVKYSKSGMFDYLVFFIYCSNYTFPNAIDFANDFTSLVRIKNFNIQTYCIIKP